MKNLKYLMTIVALILFSLSVFSGDEMSFRINELKRGDLTDSTRIEYYSFLFYEFSKYNDDTALEYGKKLLEHSKSKWFKIDVNFEFDYGKKLIEFGHFNEGLKFAKGLHKKYKSKNKYANMLKAEGLIALLYYKRGYISKSIYRYKANVESALKYKFYDYAANTLYELANIYSDIGESKNEFESLLKAYENYAKSKEDNTGHLIYILHRLGNIYCDEGKYKAALENFQKANKLAMKIKDTLWIANNYIKIAKTYISMNEIDTALLIYKNLIPMSMLMNDSSILANSYGNIGSILYMKNKENEALKYYSKAIEIATMKNDITNLEWLYKSLSVIYKKKKNYKSAFHYQEKYIVSQQSVKEREYLKKIGQAKLLYASEKKEKELEILSNQLSKNRLLTYGLGFGIILFVVIGGLIFRQSLQNNLRRISEMNHKISEITQKNLRQQMNPHFIFNTLNSIQYYMYQNDRISTNNYLTKFSSLMRKTLENSTHTSIPINDEIEALQLYLQLESLRFKDKFKWKITIDEEIDTLLYKMPTMLIQPYVENSICHGLSNKDERGFIHIDLKLLENYIEVTVEDDGIGRERAQQIKNGNHSSLGTKITESRLKLVNALYGNEMKIHYEDLMDEKNEPTGTRVIINIPIIS